MKATKITKGTSLFYFDKNDVLIKIGDNLKVNANSGRNLGRIEHSEGILEEIDLYGNFIIHGKALNVSAKCLYGQGGVNEVHFKCFNKETNGWTYDAEVIK